MPTDPPPEERRAFWRALMHRWLVEYNPLYLLSAMLVLGGSFLCSRDLAREGSLYGPLGVAAIAELYAVGLVAGAALLVRLGHRRPAVMLALLTVLYQSDLTLHTETCVNLGTVGAFASGAWLAISGAKLHALAWALRLRVSRAGWATAWLAGLGLAVGPFLVAEANAMQAGALVAAWAFALVSLQRRATIASRDELDGWGATVLRRAVAATWTLSGALLAGHVLFWATNRPVALPLVLVVPSLVALQGIRSEARVWAVALGTLAGTALFAPPALPVAAALGAAALALRALAPTATTGSARDEDEVEASGVGPYRGGPVPEPERASSPTALPLDVPAASRWRLLTGALAFVHLGAWTLDASGSGWPAHVLGLDLAFTGAALLLALAWRPRVRVALVPAVALWVHAAHAAHLVPAPRSAFQWGAVALASGFVLLGGSLVATWRLRRTP